MDWFGLTQSLSMASFREHYLPLGLSGAPWSGCSCFGASARTRFPRILSKVRVGSCLNSESFDSLAPDYFGLSANPSMALAYLHISPCRMLGSSEHGYCARATDRRSVFEKGRS